MEIFEPRKFCCVLVKPELINKVSTVYDYCSLYKVATGPLFHFRCSCNHCQIMDREECLCCHEIQEVLNKNEEVSQWENRPETYACVTDNPGFQSVCLNPWVLQVAWFQYRQQFGNQAYEGREHKIHRHVAYRQLVRWCWGVMGREIRVVLPSCGVSCIRAHFTPPGDENDLEFVGFHFADE